MILMNHVASLEAYESKNFRTLRDACLGTSNMRPRQNLGNSFQLTCVFSPSETVHSPRKRDQSCVPAEKVTLYALGVTAEMAINTLREECYRRLDQVHILMCDIDQYVLKHRSDDRG
jgi:hypothetical protein